MRTTRRMQCASRGEVYTFHSTSEASQQRTFAGLVRKRLRTYVSLLIESPNLQAFEKLIKLLSGRVVPIFLVIQFSAKKSLQSCKERCKDLFASRSENKVQILPMLDAGVRR